MLDNTNQSELQDRNESETTGRYETIDVSTQGPRLASELRLPEDSLYIDDEGAVVVRNTKLGEEPHEERMDILVLERADGRPILEISAMVPEQFAGSDVPPNTQLAQYAPDSQEFAAVGFGDALDPTAARLASVCTHESHRGELRVTTESVAMRLVHDTDEAVFALLPEAVETNVPFGFFASAEEPSNPQVGWAYFDTAGKQLKIWSGDAWIALK